ncbi:MAG: putative lipid II flippase FtsW [Ruminococcaceae bacterium]|nr:putative lipid II flippase FtsW [Oscillospiraceae bacterium]
MDSNNTDYRRRTARQDAGQQNVRRQSARQQPPRQGQPTQNSTSRRTAQQNPGRRNAAQTGAPQSTAQPRNGTQQPRRPQSRPMRTPPPAAKPIKEHNDQPTETIIRLRGSVDRPFLILVIILVLIGSAMVFSASYAYAEYHFGDSLYFIRSQLRWVVVGFGFMFIAMNFDYRWFQKLTMPAFFGTFVLLCLVPVIGKTVKGATRWIEVGPIQIQPSEMMKLALVMVLALYIAANRGQMGKFRYGILFPYTIIGAVCFVTALEKHLSATMILLMIGTLVIFIGGAPVKWLGIFMGSGAGLVALAIAFFDYARRRVEYWLVPENDPGSAGYQLLQSLYAIGSGGTLGTGLGNSRQKYLYLPESQNDFIFAVICEEFGFIGAVTIIVLFGLLLWRGIVIATHAPDTYSSILTMGIISQIAMQCIMNIAVVTGSMPVTGVSLPFFSYGGSSLIMLLVEMGMILSVSRYSYQQKK